MKKMKKVASFLRVFPVPLDFETLDDPLAVAGCRISTIGKSILAKKEKKYVFLFLRNEKGSFHVRQMITRD